VPPTVSLEPEIRPRPTVGSAQTAIRAGMRSIDEMPTQLFQPTSLAGID
jgi:hypothetical protein